MDSAASATMSGYAPEAARLLANVARVVVGKTAVVEFMLVALLCEGHVLLEDMPGLGKTLLAKTFARSLGCSFGRIQFTPDLLPSDILGSRVFNQRDAEFEFRPGPISLRWCWPTKSTAPHRAPSRDSSRRWRSAR
jgi:MoxR-like ATPase